MDGDPGAPGAQGAKVTDSSELVLSCNRQIRYMSSYLLLVVAWSGYLCTLNLKVKI